VHLFVQDIAAPLGLTKATEYSSSKAFLSFPIVRLYLFVLCSLPLFHAAHRIRYTLYDGLQIKHLNEVIRRLLLRRRGFGYSGRRLLVVEYCLKDFALLIYCGLLRPSK